MELGKKKKTRFTEENSAFLRAKKVSAEMNYKDHFVPDLSVQTRKR